ncbi:MAG: hypothetical protein QW544_02255 [Candidatus Caldarchaeum sp.]
MSQIVYTELEGQPLRWEFKGSVPLEARQEAVRQGVSFSVSQTNSDLRAGSTGSDHAVYGSNMVGQIVKWGANASKINTLKVYGRKVGSPPNPLFAEIRAAKLSVSNNLTLQPLEGTASTTTIYAKTSLSGEGVSDSNGVFLRFTVKKPAGHNVFIIHCYHTHDSGEIFLKRGSTTIGRTKANQAAYNLYNFVLLAADSSAPNNAEYTLELRDNVGVVISNVSVRYSVTVLSMPSNAYHISRVDTNISSNSTATVTSINTALGSSPRVVIGTLEIYDNGHAASANLNVGNFRLKRNTSNVRSNKYAIRLQYGSRKYSSTNTLIYYDSTAADATYSIEVYNNTSANISVVGTLLIFKVDNAFYSDGASTSVTSSPTTLNTLNTSIQAGYESLILVEVATDANLPHYAKIIYETDEDTPTIYSSSYHTFSPVLYPLSPINSNANPSVQVQIYNQTSGNAYATIIAVPLNAYTIAEETRTITATSSTSIAEFTFYVYRDTGYTGNITVEFYSDGVLDETFTVANSSIGTTAWTTITLSATKAKLCNNIMIKIKYTPQTNAKLYFRTTNASSNVSQSFDSQAFIIDAKLYITLKVLAFEPIDTVLASGSINPGSVGTSNAWISINLSSPIGLRANEHYAIMVYTVGGDASNNYVIQSSGNVSAYGTLYEVFTSSSNAGSTWSLDSTRDLSLTFTGYNFQQIYSGTISNNLTSPLGKVITSLQVRAQTSSSMEYMAFDDYTLTSPITSSSSTSQTVIEVLKATDPRLRDTPPSNNLNWSIWAAGSGLATASYTQRYIYYTVNPVTPKEFGFSELYLVADEIPPQGLVVLNDNEAGALYNSSTTATRIDSYELFRIPVKKINVVQEPTSGRIVMYLIGLP